MAWASIRLASFHRRPSTLGHGFSFARKSEAHKNVPPVPKRCDRYLSDPLRQDDTIIGSNTSKGKKNLRPQLSDRRLKVYRLRVGEMIVELTTANANKKAPKRRVMLWSHENARLPTRQPGSQLSAIWKRRLDCRAVVGHMQVKSFNGDRPLDQLLEKTTNGTAGA